MNREKQPIGNLITAIIVSIGCIVVASCVWVMMKILKPLFFIKRKRAERKANKQKKIYDPERIRKAQEKRARKYARNRGAANDE